MYHAAYAQLKTRVSESRLAGLIAALEAQDCKVQLNRREGWMNLAIPDEKMWWVLTGCITVFFENYKDVADWSFQFSPPSVGPLEA